MRAAGVRTYWRDSALWPGVCRSLPPCGGVDRLSERRTKGAATARPAPSWRARVRLLHSTCIDTGRVPVPVSARRGAAERHGGARVLRVVLRRPCQCSRRAVRWHARDSDAREPRRQCGAGFPRVRRPSWCEQGGHRLLWCCFWRLRLRLRRRVRWRVHWKGKCGQLGLWPAQRCEV